MGLAGKNQSLPWRRFLVLIGLAWHLASGMEARAAEAAVAGRRALILEVRLEGETISPVISRFLERAIQEAQEERAQCLVVWLDTPGGLVDSTRVIVSQILRSGTPVVVYVAPSGARAASAGVFITLAAHVAAMAPATTIGAAHPVRINGLPAGPRDAPEERAPEVEKIVSSTVAWARGLAELRGRNAEWAAQAVEESVTATDAEALEANVVDVVAADLADLLRQIDGREVELPEETVVLRTADVRDVRTIEMWWGERLLAQISNPNLAFLLLMLGFYGVLFELYSPGWGVAGTLGIVCLVLAFFGLAVLPINAVGLVLLVVGLALLTAEVFVTSYGALAIGGAISFALGATMLVDSPAGFARVSLAVVLPIAAATAAIVLFLVGGILRAHRARVQTGGESMVGTPAVASDAFSPEQGRYAGTVQVRGELWRGVSDVPVSAGQPLRVRARDGLSLIVEPEDDKERF